MKLSKSEIGKFVPIYENGNILYGGYQNMLGSKGVSKFYRDRSCVVTAFTNAYFYLYHKDIEKIDYNLYNDYHYYFFRKIKPWVNGVPTAGSLARRVDRINNDFGINLKSNILNESLIHRRPMAKKIDFIERALQSDSPPIFINWLSPNIKVMIHHGVCITELNKVKDDYEIVVSSWGRRYKFSLREFTRQLRTYSGLIYFEKR